MVSGKVLVTLEGHGCHVNAVCWVSHHQVIVSGCKRGSIAIWGLDGGGMRKKVGTAHPSSEVRQLSACESFVRMAASLHTYRDWGGIRGKSTESGMNIQVGLATRVVSCGWQECLSCIHKSELSLNHHPRIRFTSATTSPTTWSKLSPRVRKTRSRLRTFSATDLPRVVGARRSLNTSNTVKSFA